MQDGASLSLHDLLEHTNPTVRSAVASRLGHTMQPTQDSQELRRRLRHWAEQSRDAEPGHNSFSPEGVLMHDLIRGWLAEVVRNSFLGEEIKTATVQRWPGNSGVPVEELAESFQERLYFVAADGKPPQHILRFGADIGLFGIVSGRPFPKRVMPARLYEYATAYRRNQRGELRFLDRGRSFSFFDHHSFCTDSDAALREYRRLLHEQLAIVRSLDIEGLIEFTVVADATQEAEVLITAALRETELPILVRRLSGSKHYWGFKHVIYTSAGDRCFTSQFDRHESDLFALSWCDETQSQHPSVLCHTSTGSIERWMIIFLKQALSRIPRELPFWLSPTQVRFIPVTRDFVPKALEIAAGLRNHALRADVDDRQRSVSARIKDAEEAWIPRVVVIGQRESSRDAILDVRSRGGLVEQLPQETLLRQLVNLSSGWPTRNLDHLLLTRRLHLW